MRLAVLATVGLCAGLAVPILGPATPAAADATYVVDSTADTSDASVGNGICRTAGNVCTLRAALAEARLDGGPSTVQFDIPGSGVKTIQVGSLLPLLNQTDGPTLIDGYSQPGSAPNTDLLADNAVIRIEVRGTGGTGPDGFLVQSAGNTIRGLALYNFKAGVRINGTAATGNAVVGNFIGTNAAGTFAGAPFNPNVLGVVVSDGASLNVIGRTTLEDRNVISGNAGRGVGVFWASNGNVIQNNIVGLDPTGFGRRSNLGHGIDVNTASQATIVGGVGPLERNVVSGNEGEGIEISHGTLTAYNQVVGNYLGSAVDGLTATAATANTQLNLRLEDRVGFNVVTDNLVVNNIEGGVKLDNGSSGNVVARNRIGALLDGSPAPNGPYGVRLELTANTNTIGPDNLVTNNGVGIQLAGDGVVANTITANSITANTGLGIDLSPAGVTANDIGDVDDGPNRLLNWPVITSVTAAAAFGTSCANCTVEVFLSDGPIGFHGEGVTYLNSTTADATGAFTAFLPPEAANQLITTTATDAEGNTSEFGINTLVPPPDPTNKPPVASFTYTCSFLACDFDGSSSSDPDGSVILYEWDFGDGSTGTGAMVSHPFPTGSTQIVTLTVTDDMGALDSDVQTVIVPSPPPGTFAFDSFSRSVTGGWGSDDLASPYSVTPAAAADFSVDGVTGRMTVPGPAKRRDAWLGTLSELDVDLIADYSSNRAPSGNGLMVSLVARRVTTNREYRVRFRTTSNGSVLVGIYKLQGTTAEVALGPELTVPGLTVGPGASLTVRGRVTGIDPTTLQAKVWLTGQAEPADWLLTHVDTEPQLQQAGITGVSSYVAVNAANAPVTFSFDNLLFRDANEI